MSGLIRSLSSGLVAFLPELLPRGGVEQLATEPLQAVAQVGLDPAVDLLLRRRFQTSDDLRVAGAAHDRPQRQGQRRQAAVALLPGHPLELAEARLEHFRAGHEPGGWVAGPVLPDITTPRLGQGPQPILAADR